MHMYWYNVSSTDRLQLEGLCYTATRSEGQSSPGACSSVMQLGCFLRYNSRSSSRVNGRWIRYSCSGICHSSLYSEGHWTWMITTSSVFSSCIFFHITPALAVIRNLLWFMYVCLTSSTHSAFYFGLYILSCRGKLCCYRLLWRCNDNTVKRTAYYPFFLSSTYLEKSGSTH